MIIDSALEVPALNANTTVRDTYQKWLNDCMTVCCIMRTIRSNEFSYKFDDAPLKEIFQMLNKSCDILEDLSSTRHWSSERKKISMVQWFVLGLLSPIELTNLRQTRV